MQTPHGSRIGTTPSSACSPSVPGETVCGTHLVATSQLNEGLTEQRHTVPMILTDMMHYFAYETYSRLQLNERFKSTNTGERCLSSAELGSHLGSDWLWMLWLYKSSTETWDQTGLQRLPLAKERRCYGNCRDGAAQANTLCISSGRERPEMHQRELEEKFIHSVLVGAQHKAALGSVQQPKDSESQ